MKSEIHCEKKYLLIINHIFPFKYNYVTNSWPLYSNKFEVVLTFKDFVSDIFCTAIDFNNTIMSWLDFKIFWNILWTKKDDKAKQILQQK